MRNFIWEYEERNYGRVCMVVMDTIHMAPFLCIAINK